MVVLERLSLGKSQPAEGGREVVKSVSGISPVQRVNSECFLWAVKLVLN